MIQFGNDKIKEIYHGSDRIKEVYHGNELVWSDFKPSYMILTNGNRIDFEIENTVIGRFCVNSEDMRIANRVYNKSTIKEIHLGSSYRVVTTMPSLFLSNCTSLTDVTLDFPMLESVEHNFMYNCSSLSNLTLNSPVLISIGNFFLRQCSSLHYLTLNFPALESIGAYFLSGCLSLANTTLNLPMLESVGEYFMYGFEAVKLTLNSPALNSVGRYFLSECTWLAEVTLTAETPPIVDARFFLYRTTSLSSIYVPLVSVEAYKTTAPWSNKISLIKAL